MTIGIDASRYGHDQATGVEFYSFHIINGLIRELSKGDDEVKLYSRDYLEFEKKLPKNIENKVLKTRRLWTLNKLSREMARHAPDALLVPSHVLPLKLPKKSIITIHDVAFNYLVESYSWKQFTYLKWSTNFAVKNATKIIVPSEATKEDLVRHFACREDKISVIHHGFTPPKISDKKIADTLEHSDVFKYFKITKDTKYFLFVGRLESKKNLIRLVRAFKTFSEKNPEYKLVLAGKRGLAFDQLLKEIKALDMMEKVVMPGYVTEVEKAALFKHCQAFMFVSLYEGFGLPLLESFYFEKPVLTSRVSCLPEIGGDACLYTDPYDVPMMADKMEKLINDKKYVKKLVKLGKERLKLFTWNKAVKKTLDVILK